MLALLYLHGLSTGDFVPGSGRFLGSSADLSSSDITKLTGQWKTGQWKTGQWKTGQRGFADGDLSGLDRVYLWTDGDRDPAKPGGGREGPVRRWNPVQEWVISEPSCILLVSTRTPGRADDPCRQAHAGR